MDRRCDNFYRVSNASKKKKKLLTVVTVVARQMRDCMTLPVGLEYKTIIIESCE